MQKLGRICFVKTIWILKMYFLHYYRTSMKYYLVLLLCWAGMVTQAQDKSTYRWYFGNMLGMDFNTSPPTQTLDGQSTHVEGTSSICDAQSGALLLYSDGNTVWNRNHIVIATNLTPNYSSSTQAALLIRQPGSNTLIHLFTTSRYATDKARHFVIDISASGGTGAVVSTNNALTPSVTSEKVTATRACNGVDYWVVFERTGAANHGYYTYKLSTTGLDPTPISSVLGSDIINTTENIGAMCIAPDGRHLVSAHYGADCLLMDFDNATGVLSNLRTLSVSSKKFCYGVTFSPSSRYLYVNSGWSGPADSIMRFDMNAANIQASGLTIGRSTAALGYMELAPDGKIYVARNTTTVIATISNPDATTPIYNDNALTFVRPMQWGLPNFPQDLFIPNYAGSDTTVCSGIPTRIGIPAVSGMSYSWTPSVGLDSPNVAQPLASVRFATAYTVTVSDSRGCTVQRTVNLNVFPKPFFTLNTDAANNTTCSGSDVELSTTATGVTSVVWTPGNLNGNIVHVRPTTTTTYYATVRDANGCLWTDSISIKVLPLPSVSISSSAAISNDTTYSCQGQSIVLNAPATLSGYEWSTTETSASITLNQNATIWLRARDANGCYNSDTLHVVFRALPSVNAGADASICSGSVYRMNAVAAGAAAQSWTRLTPGAPAMADSSVVAGVVTTDVAGTYRYELFIRDQFGCTNRDTMQLTVLPLPTASISPFAADTNVCPCNVVVLSATPGLQYQWLNDSVAIVGSTAQQLTVTSDGKYAVRVTDTAGCSSVSPATNIHFVPQSARFVVSVLDSALDGQDVQLRVSAGGTNLSTCPADSATVYLHMNRYPLAPSAGEQGGNLVGAQDRVVPIRVGFNNGIMSKSLNYIGTLGAAESTSIRIDSVRWDRCSIPTSTIADTFRLAGVCRARGSARLFVSSVSAMNVIPNPARDQATISLELSDDIADCSIDLHDALGRSVHHVYNGTLSKGSRTIALPLSGLTAGMYALKMSAQGGTNTILIEVQP